MKVLQVPYHYFPEAVGGTEVYVRSLCRELQIAGVEVEIAAPGEVDAAYEYDGVRVHRYRVAQNIADVSELYGEGDRAAAEAFRLLLDHIEPDAVHLHGFTRGISLLCAEEVRRRGLGLLFTHHIPGVTCPSDTMMLFGQTVCDGVWELHRCSSCVLKRKGLPEPLHNLVGHLPVSFGKAIEIAGFAGRYATALRTTQLQWLRQEKLERFFHLVDRVIAPRTWVRDVLIRNGVAEQKIFLSPHGIAESPTSLADRSENVPPVRVAYLGRSFPIKGPQVLVEAMLAEPELPIEMDFYTIVQDSTSNVFGEALRQKAAGDRRMRFLPPVAADDVVGTLGDYHYLAVPSQGLETGPLVVLEAFAAGTPVIGSKLGGIAELVEHERNGILVDPANLNAWRSALRRVASEPKLFHRLRSGITPPRTMRAVASEMASVYREVSAGVASSVC